MKKPLYFFIATILMLTTGCSFGNIDISKQEFIEPTIRQPKDLPENDIHSGDDTVQEETEFTSEIPYSEVPETAELGERFCIINPVSSGHLYLTINKCEVFNSLNDAGMKFEDLLGVLIVDGFNYDASTSEFLKDFKMIKAYMTIENGILLCLEDGEKIRQTDQSAV
ncbi:MAG: hypothetical protein J6B01_10315 [Ruminococcus sp.]|nr:hypothetical protein [Ruminococcus sp.]